MPCVVLLRQSKKILIVKSVWVQDLNGAKNRNEGKSRGVLKIFFSPDKSRKPDFQMRSAAVFHPAKTACYVGFILKICGKQINN